METVGVIGVVGGGVVVTGVVVAGVVVVGVVAGGALLPPPPPPHPAKARRQIEDPRRIAFDVPMTLPVQVHGNSPASIPNDTATYLDR
jgi:hypothetical protein